MKLGVDLSVSNELEELGAKYYYKDKEIEPFRFFKEHSKLDSVRLRLWHHPYDENNNPYGGGTNDLETFIKLAKRANSLGMSVLLDFHYSDFWVDPSRQKLPKAWANIKSLNELLGEVYEYTLNTLLRLKEEGIILNAIQTGNEITHGMLWPFGDIEKEYDEINGGGFKGHGKILKSAIKACHEIYPEAKIIIHLEHSGSYDMQKWYFDNLINEGVEFDVIGESYYPYWHGPFNMFKECISKLMERYHKEIWVVEIGYQFEPTKNPNYAEVTDAKEGDFIIGNVNGRIPFIQSKQGQADYMAMMLKICKELRIGMVYYWEPTWIYMKDNGWAKDAGQIYCGLTPEKPTNSWIIETFFDQEGKANPIVDIFTQDYVDSLP